MEDKYQKVKNMTLKEIIDVILSYKDNQFDHTTKQQKIYQSIFSSDGVNYDLLYELLPYLDFDDISFILKYDKDYKMSFLLAIADKADEDDMTLQAIYLLRRHGLKYIIPLLTYVDEDEIREELNRYGK